MSVTAKDVYSVLGEQLHLCQRIEWCMKYLVEQAYREVEIHSPDDLKNPPKIESKWESNTDTLGKVIKAYLKGFYGEKTEDYADGTDCVKLQLRYSFNDDADVTVREEIRRQREVELAELLSIRNYLAHQFGLKFSLHDDANCTAAMAYLDDAKSKLRRQVEVLKSEIQMFDSIRQLTVSLMTSPSMPVILERIRRTSELNGKVGQLKSYDFSDMASRTIYDYTDQQEVLDAILYGSDQVTPELYKSLPLVVRLAHLQCLADMSGNPNFKAAVKKQQHKIGVFIPD